MARGPVTMGALQHGEKNKCDDDELQQIAVVLWVESTLGLCVVCVRMTRVGQAIVRHTMLVVRTILVFLCVVCGRMLGV